MMKQFQKKVFNIKSGLVVAVLTVIASILSESYNISTVLLLIISISIILFLFAFQFKGTIKLFLICLSIFIVFHLLIFPFVYIFIINKNPESIIFDSQVQNVEKKLSLEQLVKDYKPKEKLEIVKILNSLIIDDNPKLKQTLSSFNNRDILKISNYLIYNYNEILPSNKSFFSREYFVICNKEGKRLITITNDTIDLYSSKLTINEFFQKSLDYESKQIDFYKNQTEKVNTEVDFWTFQRILPYSVNIFNSDIIKAKSSLANIVVFIHHCLVIGIIFTIIVSLLPELISRKNN